MRRPFTAKSLVFLAGATVPFVLLLSQSKSTVSNFAFDHSGAYTHFTPVGMTFGVVSVVFAICFVLDRRMG